MPLALVTGASGGIGLEIARGLAARRHDLVLVARRAAELERLAAGLAAEHGVTVTPLAADLGVPGAAEALADALEARALAIDVLVNNAGVGQFGPFVDADARRQATMLELNVVALTALTRRLLPAMVRRGHGRVLNVASTAAFFPGPLMSVYYASKAYVLSLSQGLAEELRGTGVTVTALCPGPTLTGFQVEAGLADSRFFKAAATLSVDEVARQGIEGMLAGTGVVVPGAMNKVMVASRRLAPGALTARLVRLVQSR